MLRSAKKISIQSPSYQNYDGYLLAPVIDIDGLILRADRPVPAEVKEFLESKGALVNRVKSAANEFLIKLRGEFNITKSEIEEFLRSHEELAMTQIDDLDSVPVAISLRELWANTLAASKDQKLAFTDGTTVIRVGGSSIDTKDGTTITAHSINSTGPRMFTAGDTTMSAKSHIDCNGIQFAGFKTKTIAPSRAGVADGAISTSDGVDAGIFGMYFSFRKCTFTSGRSTTLRNCVVSAGDELAINAGTKGNVQIEIDRTCEWINNPNPSEFLGFKHTPGTIRMLTESELLAQESARKESTSNSSNPSPTFE